MGELLHFEGVVAGYSTPVTAAVDITLARGEVIGLAGGNGIGKSTLLKAVIGMAQVHAGRIVRAPELRVSYLAQHPVRLAEVPICGREYLACLGADRVPPPSRLRGILERRIDRLSGGEYQLLGLWAVLGGDADLALLDEPTNHLDDRHWAAAAEEIAAARERRGTLIVSHHRAFLDAVCTRVIHLGPAEMGHG